MNIGVPSGIGDISWMYSKLKHLGPTDYRIADGWPYRSRDYMLCLPMVSSAEYGDFDYGSILAFESANGISRRDSWADIQTKLDGGESLLLQANQHLEEGRRLEDWLPDLPCDFYYEVNVPDLDVEKTRVLLEGLPRPIIGVSCASYRGSEAWKTWNAQEWLKLLDAVSLSFPACGYTILLLGGFWDDLTHAVAEERSYFKDVVGKTSTGMMLQLMRELDFYIGFSSGLGVMRTVFKKPVYMLWPDFQVALSTSWAPPEMLENRSYVAHLWRDPRIVIPSMQRWIERNS